MSTAKSLSILIGAGLSPAEFYEYLKDYTSSSEYGFDDEELELLNKCFDEVKQEADSILNVSLIRESNLYQEYIKY